jgi:protein-L-isoaspartate O-methyltransferase
MPSSWRPAGRRFQRPLKIGGRLVIPVGADQRVQELVRVTRVAENEYRSEDIADVSFVPLIGVEGWATASEAYKAVEQVRRRHGRDRDHR